MPSSQQTSLPRLKVKLQVHAGGEIAMGPGKADLLDAIAAQGSISAAARALGMSYRRAWLLVDTMNRCWTRPLVETAGGAGRSGASLTGFGREILARYRALQAQGEALEQSDEWQSLDRSLLASPRPRRDSKA